jgi:LysM repeat protein/outer membrane lipoprotein SlyB
MEDYIVQYGDTLPLIAKNELGNEARWLEIAQLNNITSPYQLFVGQYLKLPNRISMVNPQPAVSRLNFSPATMTLARGLMFVVFEQLPEVGSKNVIRKVQIIPTDFSLKPKNPLADFSLADHAFKGNDIKTQFLSTSNKPYGSPTGNPNSYGELLLIDTQQSMAKGSRVFTVLEVVADLRRYSAETGINVDTVIRTIEKVEGEVLIENGVPGDAVTKISSAHTPYIEAADEIWAAHRAGKIKLEQAEEKLGMLAKSYERARIVGRIGRVLTVVGVVFTAVDLTTAGKQSYDKSSFRPIAAESVRQIGGWSGAYAGGVAGGALFGILFSEIGPGAIIAGAIGAIVFGAIGYWRGDVIAGWIDPPENVKSELRKDVNDAEGLKYRDILLTVGAGETQHQFRRRALMTAATQVQRETMGSFESTLPTRFAEKFAPILAPNMGKDYELGWIKNADGGNPNADTNKDGIINNKTEWIEKQGKPFTYRLDVKEVDELIRMVFGINR